MTREAYLRGWDAGWIARDSEDGDKEDVVNVNEACDAEYEYITREEFDSQTAAILALADALDTAADVLETLDRRTNLALTGLAVALAEINGSALPV